MLYKFVNSQRQDVEHCLCTVLMYAYYVIMYNIYNMHHVLFITCMHTCNYGHKHSHTHTHTHIRVHTYVHTHTCTNTDLWVQSSLQRWSPVSESTVGHHWDQGINPLPSVPSILFITTLIMLQSTLLLHYAVYKLGQEPQSLIKLPVSTAVRFLWQRFSQLRTASFV